MYFKPVITTGIEKILNTFIYRSPALTTSCYKLKGKVLRIIFKNKIDPFILVFSERQINVLGEWEGEADCSLIMHFSLLPKICCYIHRQQITALINSGELEMQGDFKIVQNFIKLTDFDFIDFLVPYIGEIAAEIMITAFSCSALLLQKSIQRHKRYAAELLTDLLTEEWRIAPGTLEFAWFTEETAEVRRYVDKLTNQLEKLEGSFNDA